MSDRGVEESRLSFLKASRLAECRDEVQVSHLWLANDTILFLVVEVQKFKNVLVFLQIFELISGMKIIYTNVSFLSILWCIWLERNTRAFYQKFRIRVSDIPITIQQRIGVTRD